jgi:predicted acylesterase/phospholipase RssA
VRQGRLDGAGGQESGTGKNDPAPLDDNQPPIDRYCDLILTGGVTDGVIYPWAIVELARKYRFKNIGGTSAGAMAAAVAAAAEYARRQGFLSGFNDVLLKLPQDLAREVDGGTKRFRLYRPKARTTLFALFQPARRTRRLFDLFVGLFGIPGSSCGSDAPSPAADTVNAGARSLSAKGPAAAIWRVIVLVLGTYWCAALSGVALGVTVSLVIAFVEACSAIGTLLSVLPWTLVSLPLFVLGAIYWDVMYGLVPNGFGMCTGNRAENVPRGELSLIEYLHEGIQAAARKPLDQPLTFQDLWDAPGGPIDPARPAALQTRTPRSIDLRMITTSLSHGRPYGLPLADETDRLFFKIRDLKPYFPGSVLEHLKTYSEKYSKHWPQDPDPASVNQEDTDPDDVIRELPKGDLPVVVAARLSLSVPVLFSSIPLWAIDYECHAKDTQLRPCFFSDGGICSNFPIHLFDAAIPGWPTFGIYLGTQSIFPNGPVYLPKRHYQGWWDRWYRFGDEETADTRQPVRPLDRLCGFIRSIFYSAKDWDDVTSARMPGVRDRVVRVYLEAGQSGFDLKVSGARIMQLARLYGRPAGQALIEKFIDDRNPSGASEAWDEHRWVRFNTFLDGLRERIEGVTAAADLPDYGTGLSRRIAAAASRPPLSGHDPSCATLSTLQQQDLQGLLAALKALESAFQRRPGPQPYKPVPTPTLHIRPPL